MLNSCSSLQQCWIYCHSVTLLPLQTLKLSQAEWRLLYIYWRWSLKKGSMRHKCLTSYLNRLQYSECSFEIIFVLLWLSAVLSHSLLLLCCSGSVGSKAQGGQPGSGVYGSTVAPVVSQGSGSFTHSTAATTTAPYSTDTSTDYSQYNQAYTQVLKRTHTHQAQVKGYGDRCHRRGSVTQPKMWEGVNRWSMDGYIMSGWMSSAVTEWAVTMGGRVVKEMRMGLDIWTDRMREDFGRERCVFPSVSAPFLCLNAPLWTSHGSSLLAVCLHLSLPALSVSLACSCASSGSEWHIWYLQRDSNPILNVNYNLPIQTNESWLDNQ